MSQKGDGFTQHHVSESEEATRLRRRVLDAAQRLVEEDGGLAVSLENLGMDRVIKAAGVSRTSVYREWANKEAFYVDLLCDLAGPSWQGTATFDEETIELARNVIADHLESLRTPEGREQLLYEVIRVAVRRNFDTIIVSTQWRTYVALTATALGLEDPEARARVQAALQSAEQRFLGNMTEFYGDMATVLGYRLRNYVDSYTTLAAVGGSIIEGLALRQMLVPDLVGQPIALPRPGGNEEWHLAAVAFLSLVLGMIEPNPDYDPSSALVDYLKRFAGREKITATRG